MFYPKAKQFNHRLQFLVKLKVKEVYLMYVFLTTNITLEISTGFMLVCK
jgi:hypothetical protein